MRLLPIPSGLLRNLELLRVLQDPFVLLAGVALVALPFGIAAGGRPLLALIALLAGLGLLAVLVAWGGVWALLVQIVFRKRRRAELAVLVFIVLLSVLGLVPQLLIRGDDHGARASAPVRHAERSATPARERVPAVLGWSPPGLWATAVTAGERKAWRDTLLRLTALATIAVVGWTVTVPLHRRLLEEPASERSGIRKSRLDTGFRLPFVPVGEQAVAGAAVRTFLRSVHGRQTLVTPTLMVGILAVASTHGRAAGHLPMGPLMLIGIAVLGSVGSLGVLTCNQFAVARAGLVLELLQPISVQAMVRGRMLAAAPLFLATLTPALVVIAAFGGAVNQALLLASWIGAVAVHLGLAPVASVLSAVFPRAADLASFGRARPHQAAALLHLLASVALVAPVAGLIAIAALLLRQPLLAIPLTAGWLALTAFVSLRLTGPVSRLVDAHRENLVMVAMNR
jgi:hypothetical protein